MGRDMKSSFDITIGTIPYCGPPTMGFSSASSQYNNAAGKAMANAPPVPAIDYQCKDENKLTASTTLAVEPATPSAPPAYWDLYPKPPQSETEES